MATLAEKPQVVSVKFTDVREECVSIPLDMITCEYPPLVGGIADYSREVALGLSRAGIPVRVWACGYEGVEQVNPRVTVSRSLGRFGLLSLIRTARAMRRAGGGRVILLQWEPVGYGAMSVNVPFCLWVALQSLAGAKLIVMFHETFLSYSKRTTKRFLAASLQRLMAFFLVCSAAKVYVSTEAGATAVGRLSLRRNKVEHLPVFSNIQTHTPGDYGQSLRARFAAAGEILVGHFGRYNTDVEALAVPALAALLRRNAAVKILFAGECATRYRKTLVEAHPDLEERVHSTGNCTPDEAASVLSVCDLMFQPYPDGVSSRRSTTMAALANGRFLISNFGSASEELWKHTPAVHILAADSTAGQAEEIDRIIRNPEQITAGSAEAFRFYQRNFSTERTLRALNACLRAL